MLSVRGGPPQAQVGGFGQTTSSLAVIAFPVEVCRTLSNPVEALGAFNISILGCMPGAQGAAPVAPIPPPAVREAGRSNIGRVPRTKGWCPPEAHQMRASKVQLCILPESLHSYPYILN